MFKTTALSGGKRIISRSPAEGAEKRENPGNSGRVGNSGIHQHPPKQHPSAAKVWPRKMKESSLSATHYPSIRYLSRPPISVGSRGQQSLSRVWLLPTDSDPRTQGLEASLVRTWDEILPRDNSWVNHGWGFL